MAKGLIQHIAEELKSYPGRVFRVENRDGFLFRGDVIQGLKASGFEISTGTQLDQRVQFELRESDSYLILLNRQPSRHLEDIQEASTPIEFSLDKYFGGYHIPSLLDLDLKLLDILLAEKQIIPLNKQETLRVIQNFHEALSSKTEGVFDLVEFVHSLDAHLDEDEVNWSVICRLISRGIIATIGTEQFEELLEHINRANEVFQDMLADSYQQTKNASAVKRPKIVSKILEYLNFHFQGEKIALIVVDGMAYWQYELLKENLPAPSNEEVIYTWLPSITQLSRQAIFKGDTPERTYTQGPRNEEKLWKEFWRSKGVNAFEIRYNHQLVDLSNLYSISKFAIVFKDLDEKMHTSTDYVDLLKLTENWIKRCKISNIVIELIEQGFKVFLTTDHGNIQAKGWRGLKGREKLGTNKSGSRSERHIEYTEKWLKDEFMENNPELEGAVVMEEQAIYFTSDLSFSSKETLVTHGGAHLLEVLIPFVEI